MGCDVSYHPNDALDCLSGALIELIMGVDEQLVHIDLDTDIKTTEPDNYRTIVWPGEPWALVWDLELTPPDHLNVVVTYHECYHVTENSTPSRIIRGECSLRQFTASVVTVLETLLISEGIVGYRSQWDQHEFPLSRFLTLKRFITNYSGEPISDSVKEALTSSDWKKDIGLLSRLGIQK